MSDSAFDEIVSLFTASFPQKCVRFGDALRRNDLGNLKVLAHQLKGSAGGYGFPDITALAAAVEDYTELGDLNEIASAVDALVEALESHFARTQTEDPLTAKERSR